MQELHVKSLLPVRLDKYLMEQFPALGLGRLNKALRENKIKLNGKKQPRVQNGDVIRVYLLDDQLGLTSQEGPEFLQARAPAEFIYENDDLIVANKPAGIPVDGDESDTLLNRVLRRLYEEKRWDAAHEPRLCHRLDTGTSGLVLLAKTAAAEEFLVNAIKERLIRKTYLCVTFGRPVPPAATLHSFLTKDSVHGIVRILDEPKSGAGNGPHPPDPRSSGQHWLPDFGRFQVWQQCRQPGVEAEISGSVRLGAGVPQKDQRPTVCRFGWQGVPRTQAMVLPAGTGWNAEISVMRQGIDFSHPACFYCFMIAALQI